MFLQVASITAYPIESSQECNKSPIFHSTEKIIPRPVTKRGSQAGSLMGALPLPYIRLSYHSHHTDLATQKNWRVHFMR